MDPRTKPRLRIVAIVMGILVAGSAAWAVVRIVRKSSNLTQDVDLFSVDDLKPVRSPVSAPASRSGSEIDLLDVVQISRDAIGGTWGFQGRSLVTSSVPWGRLQIPCVPPEEYDLNIVVTRRRGMNSLNLGFVHQGRQGMVTLDGIGGDTSWIDLVSGSELGSNETAVTGRYLRWKQPRTILLSVRKSGVTVSLDGSKIIDWKGEAADLEFRPGFRVPHPKALVIASWESIFEISRMTLVPVSGSFTLLN